MKLPKTTVVKSMVILAMVLSGTVALWPQAVQAQPACPTGVGGVISSNQTWSSDCSLDDDVTVNVGVTLTIDPGVVVSLSNPNTQLFINGRLNAQGTAGNRIVFTSHDLIPAKGDWGRLIFNASSTNNVLEFVTIEYGGGFGAPSVEVYTDSLTLNNVEIRNGDGDGMRLIDASPSISNTTFSNNDGEALDLRDLSFPSLNNLSAANNGFNGIYLTSTDSDTVIANDYTWGTGLPTYRLEGSLDITVDTGITLTIIPGTTIQMGNRNSAIYVNGTLDAQGTAGSPILFTSSASTPNGGDWQEIVFGTSSTNNILTHVTFEYGGGGIAVRNPSVKIRTSSLTMNNSSVDRGLEDGLAIYDASPTLSNMTFENNGERAVDMYGGSFPQLSSLSASGNGFDGVVINGGTIDTNYSWGTAISSYLVTDHVTVDTGSTLTIVPGTTVYVTNPNTDIVVDGTLMAQGTAGNPIFFTSGDPTPASGDWGQMVFNPDSSGSLLEYVTLEYAGGFGASALQISSSSFTVRNSTLARNDDEGIRVIAGTPTITRNNIFDNAGLGMVNHEDNALVTATCNWWGAASGPESDSNSGGTGQEITNNIIFDPWLEAPAPGGPCTGTNPRIYLPLIKKS